MTLHWPRVRELFEAALELPGSEREAFVRSSAAGDDALAKEVSALLISEQGLESDRGTRFLHSPVQARKLAGSERGSRLADGAGGGLSPALVRPGDEVGAYVLVREIASGGMGTVFEATQERPARTVALKVLRRGLHSAEAVRRFELEAEVLGRLKHPGIAAIFEAGVHRPETEGGFEIPYFALELVEGARPLTDYANHGELGLRERLGLFLEVAWAVHHAHQKGVIHRDLKPGNVLVGSDGQPKVIDYGVARLTDPEQAAGGPETIPGGALGTLPYMSPEQLSADADGIDVRTDVYALGAILYELLTGRTPHETAGRPLAEAVRAICEEQPVRPSAADRSGELPETMRGALTDELDWVCLRALEHDRDRRYGTAAELADDVLRFLRQEPLEAGPPTATYRLRKLYGRHRLAVTAATFGLLALVAGLVGTSVGLLRARAAERLAEEERRTALAAQSNAERERSLAEQATLQAAAERERAERARLAEAEERARAELEAQKAREMLDFLADTLAAADPAATGRELRLIDYLDRASAQIEQRFADRPELGQYLDRVVGRAWSGLGELERADRHLSEALANLRGLLQAQPDADGLQDELIPLLGDLAVVRAQQVRHDEALELLDERDVLLERLDQTDSKAYWLGRATRCLIAQLKGERKGLEDSLRATLEGLGRTSPPGDHGVAKLALSLGSFLQEGRRFAEAERVYLDALDPMLARWGPDDPVVLLLRSNAAISKATQGRIDEAIGELEEVLPGMREVLGPEHYDMVPTMNNLGALYFMRSRYEPAAEIWAESLELMSSQLPPEHPTVQSVRSNLGTVYLKLGRPDEAEPLLREMLELRERTLGSGHERTLTVRLELARLVRDHGDPDEALGLFEEGHYLASRHLTEDTPVLRWYEIELATLLMGRDRLEEARLLLDAARRAVDNGLAPEFSAADHKQLRDTLAELDELELTAEGG